MNKKTWTIIILVVIITAFTTWFFTKQNTETLVEENIQTETPVATTSIKVEVKTLNYTKLQNRAVFEYPQFLNQPARSALAKLNLTLESGANEIFKKNTKELDDNLADLQKYGMNLDGREFVHEHKIDKTRIYTNPKTNIISLIYQNYVDFGGAHGSFFYGSAIYDAKTGAELTLSDFLQGDYMTFLNTYITEQVTQKTDNCRNCEYLEGRVDAVDGKLVPESFALDANGLVLLYGAYDLGSYAATATGQEIVVPKEKLTGFIQREW